MDAIEKLRDLDHGLSDSQRLKIADIIEEQRERLIQFANAFDAGYAAAERALAERAGGVKVKEDSHNESNGVE